MTGPTEPLEPTATDCGQNGPHGATASLCPNASAGGNPEQSDGDPAGPPSDKSMVAAVEAYAKALAEGRHPDRKPLLDSHPLLAAELTACLDALELVHRFGPNLSDGLARRGRGQAADTGPGETSVADAAGEPLCLGTLGDFRLLRELGHGGMGVVYEAEQVSLGRRVALKVLPFAALLDRRQLGRFKNEAQAAAGLHHTNIVPVYSFSSQDGVYYYAMQYVEGQTLANVIAILAGSGRSAGRTRPWLPNDRALTAGGTQTGAYDATPSAARDVVVGASPAGDAVMKSPPSPAWLADVSSQSPAWCRRVAEMGIQVAEALEHAHEQGIVHRDIKPGNLLLDAKGNVWVTDFGLARTEMGTNLTLTGDVLGTLRYMSPEQAQGRRGLVDHRVDVYSLGITLYELLTLRPAFGENQRESLLEQVLSGEPPSPARLNRVIPRDLETIVLKAAAKAPQDRYQTAAELAADLRRFLDNRPIRARRPTIRERLVKWTRRHVAAVTAAAAFVVLLGVSLIVVSMLWAQRERAARLAADDARTSAETARMTAETARIETRRRLATSLVATGARYLDEGDLLPSLPYFVAALQADEGHPEREAIHRTRIAMTLEQTPRVSHCLRISEGAVAAVFFDNQDRPRVASRAGQEVHLWDVEARRLAVPPLHHEQEVQRVEVSPDRSLLVSAAGTTARLWDLATGAMRFQWSLPGEVKAIAFSGNSQRVALCDALNVVEVYSVESGAAAGPRLKHPLSEPVLYLLLDSQGSRVALCLVGDDNLPTQLALWDVATGTGGSIDPGHYRFQVAAAFSHDGKLLATGSFDATIRLTDTETRSTVLGPLRHDDGIFSVRFSPDDRRLLTASRDGTARIWDLAAGREANFTLEHRGMVVIAEFTPDGRYAVTAGEEHVVRIWEAATGKLAAPPLHHVAPVTDFAIDTLARRIVTTAEDMVFMWDLALGEPEPVVMECGFPITTLDFCPRGERLATVTYRSKFALWDIPEGERFLEFQLTEQLPEEILLSPDGSRLIATFRSEEAGDSADAGVWDAQTGTPVIGPLRHDNMTDLVRSPSIHQSRNWLLTVGVERASVRIHMIKSVYRGLKKGAAFLWDLETGERIHRAFTRAIGVCWAEFSCDGKWVVIAGQNMETGGEAAGFAEVWDVAADERAGPRITFPHHVLKARFSPDGRRLALIGGRQGQVFAVPEGTPVTPPFEHRSLIRDISFSPDGAWVVTTSDDRTARVWEADTGQPVTPPLWHPFPAPGAAFAPGGDLLGTVTGSENLPSFGPAHGRLWDAATGQPVSPPLNHDFPLVVSGPAFSPDGRYLATGGRDSTARVWSIRRAEEPVEDLMALAELFCGQRLDQAASLTPLSIEQFDARWHSLAGRYPAFFTATDRQVSVWHRRQAAGALWHGLVPAALGHLRTDPEGHLSVLDGLLYFLRRSSRADEIEPLLVALAEAFPELTLKEQSGSIVAMAYAQAGRLEEAVLICDRLLGVMPPDPPESWNHGRMWLARRIAECEELFARVAALRPHDGQLWVERGRMLALRSRWAEAVEAYRRGAGYRGIHDETFEAACAMLLSGDEAAYRDFCAAMVAQIGEEITPTAAYHLAKAVTAGPSGIAPRQAVAWAERALADQKNAWYLHALALAHYRAGNFVETIRVGEESSRHPWSDHALNELLLAMAHHQLGDHAAARQALSEAERMAQDWMPLEGDGPARCLPPCWVEFQVLRREAAELLGPDPESPNAAPHEQLDTTSPAEPPSDPPVSAEP